MLDCMRCFGGCVLDGGYSVGVAGCCLVWWFGLLIVVLLLVVGFGLKLMCIVIVVNSVVIRCYLRGFLLLYSV